MRDRRAAWRAGRLAERIAALLLRCKGYRILARGLRSPAGELDVVARRGDVLAIVEVKTRAEEADALAAVTARQRRRIQRAAEGFHARLADAARLTIRFDVVLILPGRLPRHIMDAWRP